MTETVQVTDDFELLELMKEDMAASPAAYQPTNYWDNYNTVLEPELRERGLHNLRRRRGSVLSGFGATDLYQPSLAASRVRILCNKFTRRLPGWSHVEQGLNAAVAPFVRAREGMQRFQQSDEVGKKFGAPDLRSIEFSMAGNPEEQIVMPGGNRATSSSLYYYRRFAFACQSIDFSSISTIVELGSGCGKQMELIKRCHPHLTILLFDICPQLYVCEQFLKQALPGQITSYRDNRDRQTLDDLEPGRIYTFGSWQFPLLEEFQFDLFWNCASLQEMEPDVVANYLKFVNGGARQVYLMQNMVGTLQANARGDHGVLQQVKMEHYEQGLPAFEIESIGDCYKQGHQECVWRRRAA